MKVKPFSVNKIRIPTDFSEFGQQKEEVVDLAGCENCRTSEKALAALRKCSPNMLIEHWQSQDRLIRERLGDIHNVDPSNVYLTSGAMGAIGYSFDVFVDQNTRVGLLRPDFSGFQYYADKARANIGWLESLNFPYNHMTRDVIDFIRDEDIGFVITSSKDNFTHIVHEFGHSFGLLCDEYVYGGYFAKEFANNSLDCPNCDVEFSGNENISCPKWKGIPGTGCYRGCGFENVYRSEPLSIMGVPEYQEGVINLSSNAAWGEFNLVSKLAIEKRLEEYS